MWRTHRELFTFAFQALFKKLPVCAVGENSGDELEGVTTEDAMSEEVPKPPCFGAVKDARGALGNKKAKVTATVVGNL